ncbi:SGNH/GDSL hydrolase family protein [Neorhizobium petrolearium]|uniref:SGNH/GDSL hydrolase family protein n=1 Tax=Neorhizobium petrolearium TaxID=515361 RepID=UPI003F803DFA
MGGDDPAKVFNGYIFDMEFYLDRFGLADPDVVVINLGTNEITQQDAATSLAQIQTGLNVMVSQVCAALPNAYILIVWNSLGPAEGDDRWNTEHRAALGAIIKFVNDLADSKVLMVPMYATVSRENGFRWTVSTADADTGISAITVSDGIHYGEYGIAQYGDVVAQFALALLA